MNYFLKSLLLSAVFTALIGCSKKSESLPEPTKETEVAPPTPATSTNGCKRTVHITPGRNLLEWELKGEIPCELVLTGKPSGLDYSFLRSIPAGKLKKLDLSDVDDKYMSSLAGSHIPHVVLPKKLYEVNVWGFKDSDVEQVDFPNGLKYINGWAFYNCKKLKGPLRLPNSVTDIAISAFEGCTSLTGDLILPDSVSLTANAFYGCTGFNGKLVIGKNFRGAGFGVFAYENSKGETDFLNFKEVYFKNAKGEEFILSYLGGLMGYPRAKEVTVYIPTGTRENYKKMWWYDDVKAIIEIPIDKMPS